MPSHQERVSGGRLIAAFAAVYILWGSTYLAVRVAIDTIPPFAMVWARFWIAGGLLFSWLRLRGHPRATRTEWRAAAVTGLLTLGCGNGAIVWAEQRVPSGITALLVASVSLWMVLLDWLLPGGRRPRAGVLAGVVVGLAGLVLLVGPGALVGRGQVNPMGALVLVLGSLSWAIGTIFNRHGGHAASAQMSTALQMLAAGLAFAVLSVASGELVGWHPSAVSAQSLAGLGYLVVFGSLVGFTAYIYMVRSTSTAKASTYAYVNPVVALFLGWLLRGEPLTAHTLVAAAIILSGVALITLASVARSTSEQTVGSLPAEDVAA